MFEDIDLMKFWIEDYPEEYKSFKDVFRQKFNIVAGRTKIPKIN